MFSLLTYLILQTRLQNTIYIEVCSLRLEPNTWVMSDPSIQLVFVDYHSFLDLPPEMLETPQSLPKPPPGHSIHFNFGNGRLN